MAQTLNDCVSSKMKYFDDEQRESKKSKQSWQSMYSNKETGIADLGDYELDWNQPCSSKPFESLNSSEILEYPDKSLFTRKHVHFEMF